MTIVTRPEIRLICYTYCSTACDLAVVVDDMAVHAWFRVVIVMLVCTSETISSSVIHAPETHPDHYVGHRYVNAKGQPPGKDEIGEYNLGHHSDSSMHTDCSRRDGSTDSHGVSESTGVTYSSHGLTDSYGSSESTGVTYSSDGSTASHGSTESTGVTHSSGGSTGSHGVSESTGVTYSTDGSTGSLGGSESTGVTYSWDGSTDGESMGDTYSSDGSSYSIYGPASKEHERRDIPLPKQLSLMKHMNEFSVEVMPRMFAGYTGKNDMELCMYYVYYCILYACVGL